MTIISTSHELPGARRRSGSSKAPIAVAVAAATASAVLALFALLPAPATAYDNIELSPPSAQLAAVGRDTNAPTLTTASITVASCPTDIGVTPTATTIEPRVDAGCP